MKKKLIKSILILATCLSLVKAKAQFTAVATVHHLDPTSALSAGSISLAVGSGSAPYSYSWTPGSSTTNVLSGLSPGSYVSIVSDAIPSTVTHTYNIGYKARWVCYYGSEFRNDSLIPTAPYSWNPAMTKNTLLSGNNGWAEVVVPSLDCHFILGFLDEATQPDWYDDIYYGVYIEGGSVYSWYGTYAYLGNVTEGDVFSIERTGTTFNIKQNGSVISSTTIASGVDLKLKANVASTPLAYVGVSFVDSTSVDFPGFVRDQPTIKHCTPGDNDGSISLTKISDVFPAQWDPKLGIHVT